MANHPPRFLGLVNDARKRITETTVNAVKSRLEAGEKFHLIDVREDDEFATGHLPGAIHLSKGIIERDIEKMIPNADADIVLYCGGGYRSALAADNLTRMGYTSAISMDGGYRAWHDAGHLIIHPQ
jgi:rhodanese-related sulfurtransferase